MGNTCYDCMYCDRKNMQNSIFSTKYFCTKIQQYVKSEQYACGAFLERPSNAGSCFLTTACVSYKGLPDDCRELTVLRKFRDEVMKKTESGTEMVNEYYRIGPVLVNALEKSPRRAELCETIYEAVLACIALIEQGERAQPIEIYKGMVMTLQKELLSS